MFKYYYNQFSSAIQKADDIVDQIEVTSESILIEYVAYVPLRLSTLNFILCCIVCQCINKLFQRRLETALEQKIPPQTDAGSPRPPKIQAL